MIINVRGFSTNIKYPIITLYMQNYYGCYNQLSSIKLEALKVILFSQNPRCNHSLYYLKHFKHKLGSCFASFEHTLPFFMCSSLENWNWAIHSKIMKASIWKRFRAKWSKQRWLWCKHAIRFPLKFISDSVDKLINCWIGDDSCWCQLLWLLYFALMLFFYQPLYWATI